MYLNVVSFINIFLSCTSQLTMSVCLYCYWKDQQSHCTHHCSSAWPNTAVSWYTWKKIFLCRQHNKYSLFCKFDSSGVFCLMFYRYLSILTYRQNHTLPVCSWPGWKHPYSLSCQRNVLLFNLQTKFKRWNSFSLERPIKLHFYKYMTLLHQVLLHPYLFYSQGTLWLYAVLQILSQWRAIYKT